MALLPLARFLFYKQMGQRDCRNERQRNARKTTTSIGEQQRLPV
jgi:hypothetical protein